MLKIFINSFVLFFITIDTIGNLPFFLSLTEYAKFKKRTQIAIRSTIIAFFILIAFAYIGRYLLEALGVSLDSLKIAGGIILMFIAIDILFEKRKIRREKKVEEAFDKNRDGFVISGGGGVLVLEELELAVKRNAKIYAEIVGYGATSDGYDMVQPSGEGAQRCMEMAIKDVDKIDYINAHGTSTPVGDVAELNAIKKVFDSNIPHISSTKSLSGHSLGAAGVHESIYTLLMMNNNFICESANIDQLDENAQNMNIVVERIDKEFESAMSNSFGFGGTNASLVFKKYN